MGIDVGFDMVPRLSKGAVDKQNWESFIEVVTICYANDCLVEVKPNYLEFKAGEHPRLPYEGHKFLRFSSKISGSHAEGVDRYIYTITRMAQAKFGSRVHPWNNVTDVYSFYDWQEVNDSLKSYEQLDEPEISTSIAHHVLGTNPEKELGVQLFEIQAVPEKGKGLVASVNIARGTRILHEAPLFTTLQFSPIELMENHIVKKLKSLSKDQQRQFLSLHNNFRGKHPFSGIVKTNALPCGSSSNVGGIYPTICFLNHSCLPNAHNNWNADTKRETIHAIRDINAGEEITIPYNQDGSSTSRRAHLKEKFGFDCNCNLCYLPPPQLRISDARRLQIERLDLAIGDPIRVMITPNDSLKDCHSLLHLLEEEYNNCAGASIARLYHDAFQISIAHGDLARGSVFAARGYEARAVCEGEDSPETKDLKNLVEDPTGHPNFGASVKWKTAKGMVPKGLDAGEFEKWLWRRGR